MGLVRLVDGVSVPYCGEDGWRLQGASNKCIIAATPHGRLQSKSFYTSNFKGVSVLKESFLMRGFRQFRSFAKRNHYRQRSTQPLSSTERVESKRSLYSSYRRQSTFQNARIAMALESSSLRYTNLFLASSEDSLPRGWDDFIIIDEDGT